MRAQSYSFPLDRGVPTKHSKLTFPALIVKPDGTRIIRMVEVASRHMHGRVETSINKGKVYPPKGGTDVVPRSTG